MDRGDRLRARALRVELERDVSLADRCHRWSSALLQEGGTARSHGRPAPGRAGAEAVARVLARHPAFLDGRRLPMVSAALVPGERDSRKDAERAEAADFLSVGLSALAALGRRDQDSVRALVEVAIGADAMSRMVRGVVLRGIPPGSGLDGESLPPPRVVDLAALDAYACSREITAAAYGSAVGRPGRSWAIGIQRIEPSTGCPGDGLTVVIRGSGFGDERPADVSVLFPSRLGGCVAAEVVDWSEGAIEVVVPADAAPGCVGFGTPGVPGDALAASSLAGALESCFGPAGFAAADRIRRIARTAPPPPCPPCLDGANAFRGGAAVIDRFELNGAQAVTVEPGTTLLLTWAARNATGVVIERLGTVGPPVPAGAPLPATGALVLGPFTGSAALLATYRLAATNDCGGASRTASAQLMRTPSLSVARIEVVQVVQRPDNSIHLVEGKRTVARVFVDSGVTDDFDYGAGPNAVPRLVGAVLSTPVGRGYAQEATPCGPPALALPAGGHDRGNREHAAMFEIPLSETTGTVDIEARISVAGHEGDLGGPWKATGATRVSFEKGPVQPVLPLLIADLRCGLLAPSLAAFDASLQEARKRFPISETGFTVKPPVPLFTMLDLSSEVGWGMLLAGIVTTAFIAPFTPVSGVPCGLVPSNRTGGTRPDGSTFPPYALGGMGLPRLGGTVPGFLSQSRLRATFAHEFGHSCGLNHAPCPAPGTPGTGGCATPPTGPLDARLPGLTDEVGVDVETGAVLTAGRGELMSYCGDLARCGGPIRWPSAAGYRLLSSALPL